MIDRTFFAAALSFAMLLPFAPDGEVQAGSHQQALRHSEVLSGRTEASGARRAAIHLTLGEGWKTYWRKPGDAGIPPQFNWGSSRNLHSVQVMWPTPKVFDQNGLRSIGYDGEVILPLLLMPRDPAEPIDLAVTLDIGVCRDICIPSQVALHAVVPPGGARQPAIAAARAARPYSAKEAGVRAVRCTLEPRAQGIAIKLAIDMPEAGGKETAVIEAGAPQIWVSDARTWREGGTLRAEAQMLNSSGGAFAIDRSKIRITVLGGHHAVDIRGCAAG